jgi:cell division protein FtsQ
MKNNSSKKSNELIRLRKKKIFIRRAILCSIFFFSVLVTLCLKLPYFNIENILVKNNRNIEPSVIISLSNIQKGSNVFYINIKNVKSNILSNSYIEDVSLSRRLPNTVVLSVKERDASYYIEKDGSFVVLDSNGIILEVRQNIRSMNLVKIDGITLDKVHIGSVLDTLDKRKLTFLKELGELILANSSPLEFSKVDISNIMDLNIHFSNMEVKLGNEDDLENKLNKAVSIIVANDLKDASGYINVGFEGPPVLYIEQ